MSDFNEALQTWAGNMRGDAPHVYGDECSSACAAECAGVPSFPTLPPRAESFGPGAMGAYLRVYGAVVRARLLAEAWAWRCADTLPDSAQSRRDALADAETLRSNVECGFVIGGDLADMDLAEVRPWEISFCRWDRVRESARAAFRAVPGLMHRPPQQQQTTPKQAFLLLLTYWLAPWMTLAAAWLFHRLFL